MKTIILGLLLIAMAFLRCENPQRNTQKRSSAPAKKSVDIATSSGAAPVGIAMTVKFPITTKLNEINPESSPKLSPKSSPKLVADDGEPPSDVITADQNNRYVIRAHRLPKSAEEFVSNSILTQLSFTIADETVQEATVDRDAFEKGQMTVDVLSESETPILIELLDVTTASSRSLVKTITRSAFDTTTELSVSSTVAVGLIEREGVPQIEITSFNQFETLTERLKGSERETLDKFAKSDTIRFHEVSSFLSFFLNAQILADTNLQEQIFQEVDLIKTTLRSQLLEKKTLTQSEIDVNITNDTHSKFIEMMHDQDSNGTIRKSQAASFFTPENTDAIQAILDANKTLALSEPRNLEFVWEFDSNWICDAVPTPICASESTVCPNKCGYAESSIFAIPIENCQATSGTSFRDPICMSNESQVNDDQCDPLLKPARQPGDSCTSTATCTGTETCGTVKCPSVTDACPIVRQCTAGMLAKACHHSAYLPDITPWRSSSMNYGITDTWEECAARCAITAGTTCCQWLERNMKWCHAFVGTLKDDAGGGVGIFAATCTD